MDFNKHKDEIINFLSLGNTSDISELSDNSDSDFDIPDQQEDKRT